MVNADRQYIEYNLLDSYILLIGIKSVNLWRKKIEAEPRGIKPNRD